MLQSRNMSIEKSLEKVILDNIFSSFLNIKLAINIYQFFLILLLRRPNLKDLWKISRDWVDSGK